MESQSFIVLVTTEMIGTILVIVTILYIIKELDWLAALTQVGRDQVRITFLRTF